jgi:ribosomal protein L32
MSSVNTGYKSMIASDFTSISRSLMQNERFPAQNNNSEILSSDYAAPTLSDSEHAYNNISMVPRSALSMPFDFKNTPLEAPTSQSSIAPVTEPRTVHSISLPETIKSRRQIDMPTSIDSNPKMRIALSPVSISRSMWSYTELFESLIERNSMLICTVPKRKSSVMVRKIRRAGQRVKKKKTWYKAYSWCTGCGKPVLKHHLCLTCMRVLPRVDLTKDQSEVIKVRSAEKAKLEEEKTAKYEQRKKDKVQAVKDAAQAAAAKKKAAGKSGSA